MAWKIATAQAQGSRKEQQDAFAVIEREWVIYAAVFDGLGGHPHGREAAQMGACAFEESVQEYGDISIAIDKAREAIELTGGMATCSAIKLSSDRTVHAYCVGDSPCWGFEAGDAPLHMNPDALGGCYVERCLPLHDSRYASYFCGVSLNEVLLCSDGVGSKDLPNRPANADETQAWVDAIAARDYSDNVTVVRAQWVWG